MVASVRTVLDRRARGQVAPRRGVARLTTAREGISWRRVADTSPLTTGFRVWLRRRDSDDAPFALKFEVRGGKGVLRVARPGVLIDPPARPSGQEERLTSAQVRQSRFLHVVD